MIMKLLVMKYGYHVLMGNWIDWHLVAQIGSIIEVQMVCIKSQPFAQ